MGVNWSLYETLLGNGIHTDRRGVVIEQAVQSFVSGMPDDPAYQHNARVNGTITPIIASRKTAIECSIKAPPNTDIHIGDMVECFGEMWIIVELYTDKVGIINGLMWICNDTIRFQNRSPAVLSRPCVIDDGTYSKKSSDPDAFVMANTYHIYLTIDEETRKLYVDKRLAFGKIFSPDGDEILEVYKVIGMDVKSKNFGAGSHLMVLTIQRDVYDAQADSLDDNLCDVFKTSDTSFRTAAGSCVIVGRDTVRIGVKRTYIAKFTDVNGAEQSGVNAVWGVNAPKMIKYAIDGNEVTVDIPLDANAVGEEIVICVTDADGAYGTYEKKVQVVTVG